MKSVATSLVFSILVVSHGLAQEPTQIRVGESVPGSLMSDSEHRYTIDLNENTFVFGEVDQLTVDVVVTILDPEGDQVRQLDSPARGPEKFTFETDVAGRYVIEVTPFEEAEGDYVIAVLRTGQQRGHVR